MLEPGSLEAWQRREDMHRKMGEKLKSRGLDALEANSEGWVGRMREYAKLFSAEQARVTCDDLRRHADRQRDQPHTPHAWGSVFRGKGWVCIGRAKSTYGSNHAREIRVWRWDG